MTQHIIDTDKLEKLPITNVYNEDRELGSDEAVTAYVKLSDLRALIANSPQADGMVLVPSEPTAEMRHAFRVKQIDYPNSPRVLYKAMLSAYKPQADDVRKDAWLSIETAPKDGSYVLGFENGYGIKTMTWNNHHDGGLGGWRCPNHGWRPTHWQPLPSPPLDKARE